MKNLLTLFGPLYGSAFWKFGLYFLSATMLVEILHKRMLLVEDVLGT